MSQKSLENIQDDVLLHDILSMVKNNQVSVIDFADISSKVNRLVDEMKEIKVDSKNLKDLLYGLNLKIDQISQIVTELREKQEDLIETVGTIDEEKKDYVTVAFCQEYHNDIKSKIWVVAYPILVALIFYAIYSVYGIALK